MGIGLGIVLLLVGLVLALGVIDLPAEHRQRRRQQTPWAGS